MHVTTQRTVVVFQGQSFSVRTERDIRGKEAGWIIDGLDWTYDRMIVAGSVYEATGAGIRAILECAGRRPPTEISSEVSSEMLSYSEVSELVASEFGGGVPIVEH